MGNSQGKPVDLNGEVGRGAFGKVRIVERKDTGLSFALKYIRKDEVVRSESVRNIIRERRMLEHVNHPFICNLRYSFQDIEYMYLVVDLMSGGDLRFHISRKTFTEDANVASDIIAGKMLTSKSGTLAYLAPEVYGGRGYDRPFEGNSETSLTNVILHANAKFPITQPAVSPNSDKTNFDATYDLEELLLEEAPLEARARRQKPRERLKDDATEKEIREEELYRTIERDFHSFDYTVAAYKKYASTPHPFSLSNHRDRFTESQGEGTNPAVPIGQASSIPQALTTNDARAAPPPTNGNYQSSSDPRSRAHSQGGRLVRNPSGPQPQTSQHMPPNYKGVQQSGLVQSPTGGMSFTLEGTGSWSDLARRDNTLPTDANALGDEKAGGSGGMFGFLGRKRRGYSPKPKERGVLGKEGARQIIG
ncbi:hypothetical protein EKO27_g286 [Xylaria grammica]|uniref:Protein kinase domain-containing protein n=1 Tax=Xylaria grammica TaxID=363999 RepID=A0A439DKB0_9PEZI|nr:hypothetical protein EKO27_g286 [Xylaria grammica]